MDVTENEEALKWLHKEEGELVFYLDKDGYNLVNIARMLNSYAFHKNAPSIIKPSEPLSPPE